MIRNKVRLSLLACMLMLSAVIPQNANAWGTCTSGSRFEEVYRGGEWHWRVPVSVARPTLPNVAGWHAEGPRGASLWPDLVTQGTVYVYFSLPAHVSPVFVLTSTAFKACLNK